MPQTFVSLVALYDCNSFGDVKSKVAAAIDVATAAIPLGRRQVEDKFRREFVS